ncbi:hypothetical protein A2Y26_02640 [candidate division CPR2 bacterium GWD2_39_7]|nr:MAG: hypothetical protein A2Y27_03670 [candidate division CPR2 bacterium GWD1_39_7]OGB70790.1 MAG: hypothetical protein A2Y26_02640 [candidate division CPR2 bacterium GWD2_39_7]
MVEVKTAADELGPNETKFDADNFDKEVLESDKPVLVDFYTSTCGHCIQSAPIFTETSNLLEDQVKFGKLEIRKNREYIDKYKIEGTPTFVLFKDGKEVARREGGNVTVEDFKTFINTSLNKNTPAA